METLRARIDECRGTLAAERMFAESIFSEVQDGVMYLYWCEIKGEGGTDVRKSEHDVDRVHLAFWQECIDPEYRGGRLTSELLLLSDGVRQAMV